MSTIPSSTEYAPYFNTYISKVEGDVLELLAEQSDHITQFIEENEDRLSHSYADGKWTIREVIMHLVDTEQIFGYRLLRIARGDDTPMAGFDQDDYIDKSDFSHLDAGDLIRIVENQRAQTFSLIHSLTADKESLMGIASGHKVSVRALIYMIAGHMQHHMVILAERYLWHS